MIAGGVGGLFRVALVMTCACMCALATSAQVTHAQVDPRGPVRTIATPHFRVHFRADSGAQSDTLARRAAAIAERAYEELAKSLAPPAGPVDLLLADNVDFSNGFAQVFPTNRIVVYAVPPIQAVELRQHDDWLELVISHELAHIFHLDRARGLWSVARTVFGRNPLLFPNSYTPSWLKEGLAQYYETVLTGSGRLYAPESYAAIRAAARDHAVPPISRWSLDASRYPRGATAYAYGVRMLDQAVKSSALDSLVSMRRLVDEVAKHPMPYRLNRASRIAFGSSFSSIYSTFDFVRGEGTIGAAPDTAGEGRWRELTTAGMYAESPRWRGRDSVMWSASNGREVAGVYVADVQGTAAPRRLARRNALDVNVPVGSDRVVFAQSDLRDPYTVRSDLWISQNGTERQLTHGARLIQPDARADGAIIAVQLSPARTRLVRVGANGQVALLTGGEHNENWADPRWSPDGKRIAAVQLLRTGEQRIVVLDTLGGVRQIVTGRRYVFASPSFTPDGMRLVWASNRNGEGMQVETAPIAPMGAPVDTTRWREDRADVRAASAKSIGVYEPSVSPDGASIVALVLRGDGYHVAVAPLDTMGPAAISATPLASVTTAAPSVTVASTSYRAARQLLPRYWLPIAGQGRLDEATYGVATSSSDILQRHAWAANAAVNPTRREWDGGAAYRFAGLGIPVFDLSWSQEWDATFRIGDSTGNMLGDIARRRRFATASATFARPRVRTSWSGTVGAQYEVRDFTATVDSLLGAPNALLRRGTRYPQLFASAGVSTLRRGLLAIAHEEGVSVSASSSYRWREDAPSTGSWRAVLSGRGYVPLDLPGFARHVLSVRGAVGATDVKTATEFSVGGVSGISAELLPGVVVGDPSRTFPVRGVAPDAQRGIRAIGGGVEYRMPLLLYRTAPSPFTVFLDRLSMTVFSDAGRAWCPGAFARQTASVGFCERPRTRDGWIASAGAELVLDAALQYDIPYRFRVGAARPYVAPAGVGRGGSVYVTLGSFF